MHIIDLNSTWQLTLDTENRGVADAWYQSTEALSQNSFPIEVPSCWEELVEDYEGVVWYSKELNIPAEEAGNVCRICFAASNYRTSLWINGKAVNSHEGGYTPFEFQIEDFLCFGEANHFAIRVVGPIITKDLRVDGLGANDMPHWRGGLTAGIWQSLQLKFNRQAWIADAFYQPDLQMRGFAFEVTVKTTSHQCQKADLLLQIFDTKDVLVSDETHNIELQPQGNSYKNFVELENPQLWSCENPHLYKTELRLLIDGEVVSQISERIGLREFHFEGGRFYLNGKAIYLRGGFWEGVYAKHQSYPENREVVRKEIELAKAAGLNLLRPWRRPVPPIILKEADAAGIMIIAAPAVECMSCWPTATPEAPTRIENEIRELVLRDRNHACIIWWEMFNEVTRVELARLIPKMALLARELDPTRLILDESGGWASGAHFYRPHSKEREKLSELHSYVRAPVSQKHWQLYQNLGKQNTTEGNTQIEAGAPIFMSEFGYGGLPEIEANFKLFQANGNPKLPAYRHHQKLLTDIQQALQACDLLYIYPNVDSFCRASQAVQARGNRRQLEAILSNPMISGYCIHAFTDGDWILGAGLIDHWQRPKEVYHAIAEANKSPSLLVFPEERNLLPENDVVIQITFIGPNSQAPARLDLVKGDTSLNLAPANWQGKNNFLTMRSQIPASMLTAGRNEIELQAYDTANHLLCTSLLELYVVKPMERCPALPVVIYDPNGDLSNWQAKQPYQCTALKDWSYAGENCVFLFASEDVANKADLALVRSALDEVKAGHATAIFIEPPALHESKRMLQEYDACPAREKNLLLQSGIFPFPLVARASFSFWESSMHVAKEHPLFKGLPSNCQMDEPYHEVAPAESFYELDADETIAHTITWFRPEDEQKAKKRTYLGGEDLWHGTDLAVKSHGSGKLLLSTLILRSKASTDPVAAHLLSNYVDYAIKLQIEKMKDSPLNAEIIALNS